MIPAARSPARTMASAYPKATAEISPVTAQVSTITAKHAKLVSEFS